MAHFLLPETAFHRWGKFWLAILNVHSWRGLNPTPAELWLLPDWLPIHPWKWWIHTRNVYIPMGYLSGKGFQCEEDELIRSLRQVRSTGISDQLYCSPEPPTTRQISR